MRNGADGVVVTDGPYAETVEQLTGFYIVDTDDSTTCCRSSAARRRRRRDRGPPHRGPLVGPRRPGVTAALEEALRDEWGRLLALLVAQYRRLDLAEDGLGDAFEAAARTWPRRRRPDQPARLAAHRRPAPHRRPAAHRVRGDPGAAAARRRGRAHRGGPAHDGRRRRGGGGRAAAPRPALRAPSLPREGAAALTLRLVLGVPTEDIARLFLVSTPTMAARLTRARKRLAGERFAVPSGPELGGPRRRGRRRRAPRVHRRLRPGLGRRRAARGRGRARRSGWYGCSATCCRPGSTDASNSTRCSR